MFFDPWEVYYLNKHHNLNEQENYNDNQINENDISSETNNCNAERTDHNAAINDNCNANNVCINQYLEVVQNNNCTESTPTVPNNNNTENKIYEQEHHRLFKEQSAETNYQNQSENTNLNTHKIINSQHNSFHNNPPSSSTFNYLETQSIQNELEVGNNNVHYDNSDILMDNSNVLRSDNSTTANRPEEVGKINVIINKSVSACMGITKTSFY